MKKITVEELYSRELCRDKGSALFIFGDNLIGEGQGGQAIIRYQLNAFGVPTKRLPTMAPGAFFSDQEDEFDAVNRALDHIADVGRDIEIVFPKHGLGTGLAKLKENSPLIFAHLNKRLLEEFGFNNETGELIC